MTTEEIKTLLNLQPHPIEGGSFRRTYTSAGTIELPRGVRPLSAAIYYLLEPGTFSEMHVLDSDEIFHFYLGDPAEMLQLPAPPRWVVCFFVPRGVFGGGETPFKRVVPAGVWQGTRLLGAGKVA